MTGQSIAPFADDRQNTQELFGDDENKYQVTVTPAECVSIDTFIQDVELLVCAKLNASVFRACGDPAFRPTFSPQDLTSRSQAQPYAIARHFACYLLYKHPYARGHFSSTELGKRYKRDHTSILSGLRRATSFILTRHAMSFKLQAICDALSDSYGAFNVWTHEGCSVTPAPAAVMPKTEAEERYAQSRAKAVRLKLRNRNMAKLYEQEFLSLRDLSERYGITHDVVRRILKCHGVALRSVKQGTRIAMERRAQQ